MGTIIRREEAKDHAAVEALVKEAFWNVYHPGCNEHIIVRRGRDDAAFVPELDPVIELDGGGSMPALIFGPVSIAPAHQRRGYGRQLIDYSLNRARELGARCVCIEGNIAVYGRSGFVVAGGKGIFEKGSDPGVVSPHFLLCELVPGALYGKTGRFVVPDIYYIDEMEV